MPHTKIHREVQAYVEAQSHVDEPVVTPGWLRDTFGELDRAWALDLSMATTALNRMLHDLDSERCQPGDCTRDPVVLAALPFEDSRGVHYLRPDTTHLILDVWEVSAMITDVLPSPAQRQCDPSLVRDAVRTFEDASAAMKVLRRGHGIRPWSQEPSDPWSTRHLDVVTNALNLMAHTIESITRSTLKVRRTASAVLGLATDFGGGVEYT